MEQWFADRPYLECGAPTEKVAVELLRTVLKNAPGAEVVGQVTAVDLAKLASRLVDTCPICGATAWVNIDCDLCNVCAKLKNEDAADSESEEA